MHEYSTLVLWGVARILFFTPGTVQCWKPSCHVREFHFISFHVIHSFTHLLGRSSPLDHVIFLKEKKNEQNYFLSRLLSLEREEEEGGGGGGGDLESEATPHCKFPEPAA